MCCFDKITRTRAVPNGLQTFTNRPRALQIYSANGVRFYNCDVLNHSIACVYAQKIKMNDKKSA